jgi:hypothetical protein
VKAALSYYPPPRLEPHVFPKIQPCKIAPAGARWQQLSEEDLTAEFENGEVDFEKGIPKFIKRNVVCPFLKTKAY